MFRLLADRVLSVSLNCHCCNARGQGHSTQDLLNRLTARRMVFIALNVTGSQQGPDPVALILDFADW